MLWKSMKENKDVKHSIKQYHNMQEQECKKNTDFEKYLWLKFKPEPFYLMQVPPCGR